MRTGGLNSAIAPIDDAHFNLAPYVWKRFGAGTTARAEATMPGAYLKAAFEGSTTLRLLIDGSANAGCPASSRPVIEYSVDEGPFRVMQLAQRDEVYALPLAEELDDRTAHRVEITFRAADLAQQRWRSSAAHLRIAGVELDAGGSLRSCARRPKRAIGYGDSITEGVGVDGFFTSWQSLEVNNARATWFPMVCAALDCEYGQLGSGGQGMVRPIEMPVLGETWDHYDAYTSRLVDGRLLPEPDYVFCCMGTNDFRGDVHLLDMLDIGPAYRDWLAAVRSACPTTIIFCIVPPIGWHDAEIAAAVDAWRAAGDLAVHRIDTAPLAAAYGLDRPTQAAYDRVHPSVYGHALLAALVAAEARRCVA